MNVKSGSGAGSPSGETDEARGFYGNCLAILGLGAEAEAEDIRKAYRRLAMRYHPDSSRDPGTARQFARVVKAYKILSSRAGEPPSLAVPPRERYRRVLEAGEDLFALGQILASDPDPGAREEAARRLGLSGRAAAFVFLRRALYDASETVALTAVKAVASIGSRQAEGEVAALYSRSGPALRKGILAAAKATKERLFRATIAAAASDPDPLLRVEARRLAAEIR